MSALIIKNKSKCNVNIHYSYMIIVIYYIIDYYTIQRIKCFQIKSYYFIKVIVQC